MCSKRDFVLVEDDSYLEIAKMAVLAERKRIVEILKPYIGTINSKDLKEILGPDDISQPS